ncbi:MAG: universal stress protein [Zoogloea sp.]|nr:universal stress protein [Zoogloea sp.]MBP8897335.1 universal stress protein [Sulfuritalea sp.]MCC7309959.1 universal stress protein [Sulfuritalea sp.]
MPFVIGAVIDLRHCLDLLDSSGQQQDNDAHEMLVSIQARAGCDLIIMGTHARSSIGKFFLGSVAAFVLGESEMPVLLYR